MKKFNAVANPVAADPAANSVTSLAARCGLAAGPDTAPTPVPTTSMPTTPPPSSGASDELQLLKDNYMLYVDVARAPADPRARESASGLTI